MLRGEVEGWQIQLYQLVDFLPEQTPPDEVWEKLSTRIIPRRNRSSGIWQSLTFWRSVSVLAACAILLVIGLGIDREVAAPSDHHIVVADQQQRAVWLITTELTQQTLTVKTLSEQTLSIDQSFELWLIVSADSAPISLGLINEIGSTRLNLSAATSAQLANAAVLAVSVEPAGGSPNELPSGPVIYQGVIVR